MHTDPQRPASPKARLFVALWPDVAVREQLLRIQAAWRWPPGAALTPPERLHVTLHFIGDVDRDRVSELAAALRAVRVEPVSCRFDTAELWPGGVAVLCASRVPASLTRMQVAVRATIERVQGLAGERRRFQPHVTLARKASPMAAQDLPFAVQWTADRFALVESLRGAATAYRSIQAYGAPA